MRTSPGVVATLLFGSGFSALLYQTAWQRSLRLFFGASTAASAAVLAVFLGALGAGGLWIGNRAERHGRPLMLYGELELGVATTAAVSPFLIDALGKAYLSLGGVATMGQGFATVIRLLVTAIVIGPAGFMMGGTLPAAARAAETETDEARTRVALLYGMNTLGAVAGALFGTFVLFELFGVRLSLWTVALLNGLVGVVARALGRADEEIRETEQPAPAPLVNRTTALLACVIAAGVGFAFLLLELVWYRLLAPLLGGSTYTFGLVLAVALAGIGFGGWLYSRRDPARPVHPSDLALVTVLESVVVAFPIALGDRIALYAILTRPLSSLGFPALVLDWASIAAIVVFPAALVSGYQFPMLFALLGSGRRRVARHVGAVYAFNTTGALLGSLLGGFVLIPRLSAVGCFRSVAVMLLVLALLSSFVDLARAPSRAAYKSAVVVLLGSLGIWFAVSKGPTAVFRHLPIGVGRVVPPGSTINELRAWTTLHNDAVLWEKDGVETAVALTKGEQLSFIVDGKSDGAVYTDRATQAGSGLIGALLHPAPKRSLVIGLGTGMTAGYLAVVPGMEHVDVAELEPSILEVARVAAPANEHVLTRSNVSIHLGDGREFLLSTRERYDLIVSEPSNPYRTGVSSLYTREYYEAVGKHLREGGLFVQWVQGYETDARTVAIIARTLRRVLSSVEAWQTEDGDILFIASSSHRVIDAASIRDRIEREPFASALPRTLLIGDVEGLLGRFLSNDVAVAEMVRVSGNDVNTDDRNVVEYAFARGVGFARSRIQDRIRAFADKRNGNRPDVRGEIDWQRVDELRPRAFLVAGEPPPPLAMPNPAARLRSDAIAFGCTANEDEARKILERIDMPNDPRDDVERFVVAVALANRGDDRALFHIDRLAARGFLVEAAFLRARRAFHAGDADAEMNALMDAVNALRERPFPLCAAAKQVLTELEALAQRHPEIRARAASALADEPFATYIANDSRIALAERLAAASGDAALCVKVLGAHVANPPWNAAFLEMRLRCLAAAGHPEATLAATDLFEYRSATASDFE